MSDTVDHDAVAQGNKIYPTAAALTASNCTVLVTEVANGLSCLVKQLRGEWTGTDTGAVGLHDAEHLTNLIRTDAQTGAGSGADGVR